MASIVSDPIAGGHRACVAARLRVARQAADTPSLSRCVNSARLGYPLPAPGVSRRMRTRDEGDLRHIWRGHKPECPDVVLRHENLSTAGVGIQMATDYDAPRRSEADELAEDSLEELTVKVLPKQADEFTCSRCFLVHHRSRLAEERNGQYVCRDCAA